MSGLLLASNASGISFIVLLSVFTLIVLALAVWLICIGLKGEPVKFKLKPIYIFIILLVIGAAARMAIGFSIRGLIGSLSAFSSDRTGFTGLVSTVQTLLSNGFTGFEYTYDGVYQYPLTMFILAFFGSICNLFGSSVSLTSTAALVLIKLPFVISDMLLAFVVYKIVEKYTGDVVALGIGGIVAVCPVFMLGTIWPSVYSFLALALVATLYFVLERRYIMIVVTYTLALLISFEAVYLLPVIAVFLIYAYIKKIIAYRASEKKGIRNSEYSLIISLPIAIVACMAASYIIILPFALSSIGANPFVILYHYYLRPFNMFGYFTYNGLSLYSVFNKNGAQLALSFPTYVFSILFAVAITAVTLIIYLTKKNRANLVMYASYMLLTINVYFVNSSELTLLPFLAITLIAFAVLRDRRLFKIFGLMALVVFINASGVLLKAGYLVGNASYASELLSDSWLAYSIVTSLITVLTHLYYTIVVLDIVMNGRIKKLSSDGKFGSSLKALIKIKD